MFKNRNWGGFLNNLKKLFNSIGTYITFISTIMMLIGIKFPDNSFPYIFEIGLLSFILSLIWIVFEAWPEKILTIKDLNNTQISLENLNKIHPAPFKLGIIGCSKSGKTTFLQKASFSRKPLVRTNEIYANVFQLPDHLNTKGKIILLDGDGKQHPQQFNIMERSNLIIIFFDHDESNDIDVLNNDRKNEHNIFFQQLIFNLRNCTNLKYIHIVINKHDLWGKSQDSTAIIDWIKSLKDDLEKVGNYKISESFQHCNNNQDSIAEILEHISQYKGFFDASKN